MNLLLAELRILQRDLPPFEILFGLPMNFNSYGGVKENVKGDGFENIRKHREKMWQEVKENIEEKAQKMKSEVRRRKEFKIGDKVMVKELGLKRKAQNIC